METGKPLISVLLAVYEPRLDWLEAQLRSLAAQTYPNLRVYIRDDASPTVPLSEIRACAAACLGDLPWTLERNERNLGSTATFERLTAEAEGEYFAYGDQDDIWRPEKLAVLLSALESTGALLVCSDMTVLDAEGRETAASITKVRRHHVFRSGEGLAPGILFHNFVTGCTMLVRAEQARAAIPFCPHMVHDHYLALWCAERGRIEALPQTLVAYRVHDRSQTPVLAGAEDKTSYGRVRIGRTAERLRWLSENFPCGAETKAAVAEGLSWAEARERNWARTGGRRELWRLLRLSPLESLFELAGTYMPEGLFRLCLRAGKRNWV